MYGGGANEPDAKKQRVDQEEHRVRRDTFVESMLFSVANTLASDSEYGYNAANRIRRRVEAITENIDDKSEDALRLSSRAVLESRFALGFDDAQYLSQAVSLLWAGDGGERLRIAPLNSMPEILRVASAKGMVRAMSRVVKRRKKDALASIKRAMRLSAWLMQIKIVRVAVLDVLKYGFEHDSADRKMFNEVHEIVSSAFKDDGSLAEGSEVVLGLMDRTKSTQYMRAIVMAFCVIMQPSSTPNAVFAKLLAAMNDTVLRTERDMAKLFRVAEAMDGATGRVVGADTNTVYNEQGGRGVNDNVCENRNAYHASSSMTTAKPKFDEFCTAVNEAVSRITGSHNSLPTTATNVATKTTFDESSSSDPVRLWVLQSILSPMWKPIDPNEWNTVLRVQTHTPPPGVASRSSSSLPSCSPSPSSSSPSSSSPSSSPPPLPSMQPPSPSPAPLSRRSDLQASIAMFKAVKRANQNRLDYGDNLRHVASDLLDGKLNQDEAFVQYAMTRGLCGHRGIHQASNGAVDEVVAYDYPTYDLKEYKKGEFVEQPVTELSHSVLEQVYSLDEELYDTNRMQLDTDFYGNATRRQRVSYPSLGKGTFTAEEARRARWIPIVTPESNTFAFDAYSQLVCQASVYEFMALSLSDPSQEKNEHCKRSMNGAAAVAKLRQLECMAVVKSHRPDEKMLYEPTKMGSDVYVTRPCANFCPDNSEFSHVNIGMPVDAGIAHIKPVGPNLLAAHDPDPVTIRSPGGADEDDAIEKKLKEPFYMSYTEQHAMPNNSLSVILANGMQVGWNPIGEEEAGRQSQTLDGAESSRSFSLFMGPAADAQPLSDTALGPYALDTSNYDKMLPDDLHVTSMFNVFGAALEAINRIEQIEYEEKYVERFKVNGSEEQQRVFGLQRSVEDATRDRRADLWTDALREVAISGDRLYRFVTELTGAIGESADAAISWEDGDLKAVAKEAATKQKAVADRVSSFQTKLVESVVSSTLRASKLQLDVRDRGDAANELVVVNTEVKEGIRQITSGEAGHGFFEASVELGNLLGTVSKPITIKDLVKRLQDVSMEFQDQLQNSMSVSAPMSYSRVSEPRNSFMMHLKPDTVAAIHKAFDLITSEMRMCSGFHRHVYLWEYVEGKDWVLSSRFAELTGLMLQNTRMRSGSFAAYVGTAQIITNTHNVRMQIQKLKSQVCSYIMSQCTPQFLSPSGRTIYFGGTMQSTSTREQMDTSSKVKESALGKEGGFFDDFWGSTPNPEQQGPRPSIVRQIKEVVSKIERGEVDANNYAVSSGYGLDLVLEPTRLRRGFGNATQGQVMSSAQQVCIEKITTPEQCEGVCRATVQNLHDLPNRPHDVKAVADGPDAVYKRRFDDRGPYGWANSICEQFEEQQMAINPMDQTESFFADVTPTKDPDHDPLVPNQAYHVVKFQFTPDMLQQLRQQDRTFSWRDNNGTQIKGIINMILKTLFNNQKSDESMEWVPHSKWDHIGDNSQHADKWLFKVNERSKKFRQDSNTALYISRACSIAIGTAVKKGRQQSYGNVLGALYIAAQVASVVMGEQQALDMVTNVLSTSYKYMGMESLSAGMGGLLEASVHRDMLDNVRTFGLTSTIAASNVGHLTFYRPWNWELLPQWTGTYQREAKDYVARMLMSTHSMHTFWERSIKLDILSNDARIKELEANHSHTDHEYHQEQLTCHKDYGAILNLAAEEVSQLKASTDNSYETFYGKTKFQEWRQTSRACQHLDHLVTNAAADPRTVKLQNRMCATTELMLNCAEIASEAIQGFSKLSPKEQQQIMGNKMAHAISAHPNPPILVKQSKEKTAQLKVDNSPLPSSVLEISGRKDLKTLCLKELVAHFESLRAEAVTALTKAGAQPTIAQTNELSLIGLISGVLNDASEKGGAEGINSLGHLESDWSRPTQFAVRAMLQWESARLTQFQEVLAPVIVEMVNEAKQRDNDLSTWLKDDENRQSMIDIIKKNPLIQNDITLATQAAEYLASPVYIPDDARHLYNHNNETIPSGNYFKFMSLVLGTAVAHFDESDKMNHILEEIKKSYPDADEPEKGKGLAWLWRMFEIGAVAKSAWNLIL